MKIALAFLLVGLSSCFVSTDANAIRGQRKLTEAEGFFHGRLMFFILFRLEKSKGCTRCSDAEKYYMDRCIVEDLCLLLKLLTEDMKCSKPDFLHKMNIGIDINIFFNAVEHSKIDDLHKMLRPAGKLDIFVNKIVDALNGILKEVNMDLGKIIESQNDLLGGVLNAVSGVLSGVVGGVLGGVTGVLGGALSGITGGLGGAIGGLTGAVGGLTGGLGGAVGGITGGLGGAVSGLTGAVGGITGGLTGALGGLTGGLGGLTGALGGLTGGLGGGGSGKGSGAAKGGLLG
ncbi:uncharacterized protein LOC142495413 isoform X1 [Ascaphus truei]|uniref:uncharacterized protein LOC142495413 isoform X1 n=2 Tax=Ascaphus truei TaxID=8439 RepID=UPI003F5967D0